MMRGSGDAPVMTASRSDCNPPQVTSAAVRTSWLRVPSSQSVALRRIERTGADVSTVPPRPRTSAARACATALKSTMAVCGEWMARRPAACGSISRMPSAGTCSRSGTPFDVPRRNSSSSRGSSAAVVAIKSLPQRSTGMRGRQVARSGDVPDVQLEILDFIEDRRIVQHALLGPVLRVEAGMERDALARSRVELPDDPIGQALEMAACATLPSC